MKKTSLVVNPASPYTDLINLVKAGSNAKIMPRFINNLHIIQLGAGGTGGYVAYEILRLLGNLPAVLKPFIHYTLIDGDVYEAKNLGRQLCCEDDLGKYKSQVIIEDFGELFGVGTQQTSYITEYFESINQLASLGVMPLPLWTVFENTEDAPYFDGSQSRVAFGSPQPHLNTSGTSYIILDCVDKNRPRKLLSDYFANINSLPSTLDRINYAIGNGKDAWELTIRGKNLYRGIDEANIGAGMYGNTPVRDIYCIASGNGKYTGQVSWGRKVFLGNSSGPLHYKDIYGDTEVSTLLGRPIPEPSSGFLVVPRDISLQSLNEVRLDVLAREHYNIDTINLGTSGIFSEIKPSGTGEYTEGAITSLPVPMKFVDDDWELDTRHPMMRNMNAFNSAFMSTPMPYDRFPELIDVEADAREEAMSCAERAEHNVQSINANKTAAAIMINYFTSIFNGMYGLEKEIPMLTTETTRFNILTGEYSSDPITTDSLSLPNPTVNFDVVE